MAKLSMPGSMNVIEKRNAEFKGKTFKNPGKTGSAAQLKKK